MKSYPGSHIFIIKLEYILLSHDVVLYHCNNDNHFFARLSTNLFSISYDLRVLDCKGKICSCSFIFSKMGGLKFLKR